MNDPPVGCGARGGPKTPPARPDLERSAPVRGQAFKQDKLRVDPDGVTIEHAGSGSQLRDVHNETRTRFQDLIAANLNTRRAIRAMVLPALAGLQSEVLALRAQLDRIEAVIAEHRGA